MESNSGNSEVDLKLLRYQLYCSKIYLRLFGNQLCS